MRRLIESGAVPGHPLRPGRSARLLAAAGHLRMDAGTGHGVAHHAGDLGARLQGSHEDRRRRGAGARPTSSMCQSISMCSIPPTRRAPGRPEPGGITSVDLLRMVRQLCYEHDVVGVDVVEVSPAYDHAELTVNAAHRVVFEALCGHGGPPPRRRRREGRTALTTGPVGCRHAGLMSRSAPAVTKCFCRSGLGPLLSYCGPGGTAQSATHRRATAATRKLTK